MGGASRNNAAQRRVLRHGAEPAPDPHHRWPQRAEAGLEPHHLALMSRRGWGPWTRHLSEGLLGNTAEPSVPSAWSFYGVRGGEGAAGARRAPRPPRAPRMRRRAGAREYAGTNLVEEEYPDPHRVALSRPRSKGLAGPLGRGPSPALRPKTSLYGHGRLGSAGGWATEPGADIPPQWTYGPRPWPLIWDVASHWARAQWARGGRLRRRWGELPSRQEAFAEALAEDYWGAPHRDLACLGRAMWRAGEALWGAAPYVCTPLPPLRAHAEAFRLRLGPLPSLYYPTAPAVPPAPSLPATLLAALPESEPVGGLHALALPLTLGAEMAPFLIVASVIILIEAAQAAWAWGEAWGAAIGEAVTEACFASGHAGRAAGAAGGGLGQLVVADVARVGSTLALVAHPASGPEVRAHTWAYARTPAPFNFPDLPSPYVPASPRWPQTVTCDALPCLLALGLGGGPWVQTILLPSHVFGPREGGGLAWGQAVARQLVWPYPRQTPVW